MPPAPDIDAIARKLGLASAADLILHLPLRYEDETRLTLLRDARPGHPVLLEATVMHSEIKKQPRRQLIVELSERPDQECGNTNPPLFVRLLHFYPSQVAQLRPGLRLRLFGEVRPGLFGAEMVHPRYRVVKDDSPLRQSLTPIYPTVAGVSQSTLQRAIPAVVMEADLGEILPKDVLTRFNFPYFSDALGYLHAPPADADIKAMESRHHPAWRRLKFDELLAQQLSLRRNHAARQRLASVALDDPTGLARRLARQLPFSLTHAQQRVDAEIRIDLAGRHPMHRLLQGDVGSGKTCIAALAALRAAGSGYQSAVMAPTEILAEQHYRKLAAWLEPLGIEVAWLTGSLKKRDKEAAI